MHRHARGALADGRDFLLPDDPKALAVSVLALGIDFALYVACLYVGMPALLAALIGYLVCGFFVTVLYAPQFMEKILGYSALRAGVGMLPMLGMFAVTSFIAGPPPR